MSRIFAKYQAGSAEGELTGVKLARGRVHALHMILEKEVLTSKRTEREVGQQRPEGEAK
jgi:hypothetical protein